MSALGWTFASGTAQAETSARGADYIEVSIDDEPADDLALRIDAEGPQRIPLAVIVELLRRRGFVVTKAVAPPDCAACWNITRALGAPPIPNAEHTGCSIAKAREAR